MFLGMHQKAADQIPFLGPADTNLSSSGKVPLWLVGPAGHKSSCWQ